MVNGARPDTIRFGTRGSALARTQTDLVIRAFEERHPEISGTPIVIRTEGDLDQTSPLTVIGGRGVFTSALQEALRRHTIDAAVHSAKDLPSDRPTDLRLVAFVAREDPRDAFVTRHGCSLAELRSSPMIGTSSRRRAVQIRSIRPDARIVDLRGNIDTRLRKAFETDLDGIVIAAAGVARMGWSDSLTEYLPLDIAVPSPGQGALVIEIRADESGPAARLGDLNDIAVSRAVEVERSFLQGVGGGCTTPVGALATIEGAEVRLRAMLASDDGERVERADVRFDLHGADKAAFALAGAMRQSIERHLLHPVIQPSMAGSALSGKRVLVTRDGDDDPLVTRLCAYGAEPFVLPTVRIEPPSETAALVEKLRQLPDGTYDWVVFTSGNAVDRVCAILDLGRDGSCAEALAALRVAAVGQSTACRLERQGVRVDLVPNRFTGAALVQAMTLHGVEGQRVLFPHGNLAGEVVQRGLAAAGASVDAVEAYRTLAATPEPAILNRVRSGEADAAIFLSPSSVRNLCALLGGDIDGLVTTVIACIGPVTAEAARETGLDVHVVPPTSTLDLLVEALERHFSRAASSGLPHDEQISAGHAARAGRARR